MKYFKRAGLATVGFVSLALTQVAQADLLADATTELGTMKTSAETMSSGVFAIIVVVALATLIYGLTRKAR